jgi:hypothetical protein
VFCGPETAVVARGEAKGNNSGRVIYPRLIPWGVSYTGAAYIRTTFGISIKCYCTCKLYCEQSQSKHVNDQWQTYCKIKVMNI